MLPFRCIPIPTDTADRWRRTGAGDRGTALRRVISDGTGAPCRHCLRNAGAGDAMMLSSYDLPRPLGIYWTPSPIFLHAEPCEPYGTVDALPPIVRTSLVSVRAYDAGDQCLYDLGVVADGREVDGPLDRALSDPRTAFVNLHTARPGCMLCRVERR